jgi:hypothetical protein
MLAGVKIEPEAIYDDGALVLALGIASAALVRARRQGQLRFRRVGNRSLYLGRWILDWLATDAKREEVPHE